MPVNMVPVPICGREDWTILMPEERAARVQWPWHEWNRFHSMFHNLRPGDVLFDIGAEQGDQSALYQRWIQCEAWPEGGTIMLGDEVVAELAPSREGGIVLVEPNPAAWANIRAVWEANDLREPLLTVEAFTSNFTAGEPFVEDRWPLSANYQIAKYVGMAEMVPGSDVISVDEVTVLDDVPHPDAITVDIEGGELDALRGAARTLVEHRPLVWVSIHWQELLERGQSRQELIDYMALLGYEHEHLGQDHEIHALFWHPESRRPVLPYDHVHGS